MKKFMSFILTMVILTTTLNIALAAQKPDNSVNSDAVFDSITTTLTTSKTALFSAYTKYVVGSIKVASCWLQKKVGNNWTYVCSLPAPTTETTNTFGYGDSMDYSSYIPSDGCTYRVAARYVADGHHATRYSNERTF